MRRNRGWPTEREPSRVGALKRGFGIEAGSVVGHQGEDLFDSVLKSPGAEHFAVLRQGQRRAHDVGGFQGDDRSRRIHHHGQLLGFGGKLGNRQSFRRDHKAGENVDMVVDEQLLRQTLGLIRRAGRVLADQFDLLAGDHIAVLLHVELDAVIHLRGRIGELTGIGHEQADLDGVLRACGDNRQAQ
jgi:hypothetical protein